MRIRDLLEDGRIVKGVNTTADVDTNSISREAAKFGNKVDKDGKPPTLSKKVKGKSTNVLYNLGLAEGKMIPNPPNTFLTKSDTAYDHYKIGTNLANLKAVPKGANYDEPDVVIAPYAGKKEMKYLMKQLKRIGYDVQDAAGYKDAHYDDEPTGGEAPPQVKNYGPLGRVKLGQLRTVQKERSYKKLIRQLERVLKDDYAPIQIDRKGRIVNGHHRYDALRLAGAKYARVHMADDVLEDMLDEGWSKKYKDSINCSNPKGFSQKAHCAGRKKNEDIDDKTQGAIKKYQQTNTVGKTSRSFSDIEEEYLHIRELALKLIKNGLDPYTAYYKASEKMQFNPAMVFDWMGSEFKDEELEDFIPIEYEPDWIKRAELGMTENFAKGSQLDSLRKFVRSQREAPDQVLYQMMMAPDTYGHSASNFVRSWYEKTKEENGLNDVDSALEIMVDELGINENFADGKRKGKSRPGRVKRAGASCKGSVTKLRKQAKNASGEKARMYHWCANMKSGRKKKS